jgi:hypothetical protein
VFVALPGERVDGHDWRRCVQQRGYVTHPASRCRALCVVVADPLGGAGRLSRYLDRSALLVSRSSASPVRLPDVDKICLGSPEQAGRHRASGK